MANLSVVQIEKELGRKEAERARAQAHMKELVRMRVENLISDQEFQEQRAQIAAQTTHTESTGDIPDAKKVESALVDLDSVSGYLTNLDGAWNRVVPQYQRWFQQIMIPAGYAVGAVGTAQKGRLLSFLSSPLPVDTDWVPS